MRSIGEYVVRGHPYITSAKRLVGWGQKNECCSVRSKNKVSGAISDLRQGNPPVLGLNKLVIWTLEPKTFLIVDCFGRFLIFRQFSKACSNIENRTAF